MKKIIINYLKATIVVLLVTSIFSLPLYSVFDYYMLACYNDLRLMPLVFALIVFSIQILLLLIEFEYQSITNVETKTLFKNVLKKYLPDIALITGLSYIIYLVILYMS